MITKIGFNHKKPVKQLMGKIQKRINVEADIIYTSTEMQNSLSAAWIDPSPQFIISEGDKIILGIYDNDTLADHLVGRETHLLENGWKFRERLRN